MMTRGVRTRLIAFVVLAAVGVTYASANYLGLVDRVLGRGYSVTAELPTTGGLYVGSLVTYRGVQIGKVGGMQPQPDGVAVRLDLEENAQVPADSEIFVHNGSAVGEQYLDFEPKADEEPFLEPGDTVRGGPDSLPVDEADLLLDLDDFVASVDKKALRTTLRELGLMFDETGPALRDIVEGGNRFIDEAARSKRETIRLLRNGRTVLGTQEARSSSIRDFASGLAQVTGALRAGDSDVRTILDDAPPAARELDALLRDLEPTMPVLLGNLTTVGQVVTLRLKSVEQLLVTYPVVIASGFTGTTPDGFGHVHLEYTNEPPPCTKGYLPANRWRQPNQLNDVKPYLKAHCASPPPYTSRGSKYHPEPGGRGHARVAPRDARTGTVADGDRVLVVDDNGASDVYGKDAWKWMLVGPTVTR